MLKFTSHPVTPEICETVALYFSIPTEKEHHLAMQIRMALEAYVDSGVTKVLKGRFIHSAFKPQLKIQF